MRPLDLDYCYARRASAIASLLLAIAVGMACYTAVRYRTLAQDVALKQERLSRLSGVARDSRLIRTRATPEEYAFARQTAWRLSLPWDRLFAALEAASNNQIALLAIEPDLDAHSITVSGEAKDYLAALSYVADLSEQRSAFAKVYLQRHELRKSGTERAVAFTVSAAWSEPR
jgi:hypothetical protein